MDDPVVISMAGILLTRLVTWLLSKVIKGQKEIHVLVNSRLSETLEEVKELREEIQKRDDKLEEVELQQTPTDYVVEDLVVPPGLKDIEEPKDES